MFGCYTKSDSAGRYYSVNVSTRDFVELKVDIYLMQESTKSSDDDEQLSFETGVIATHEPGKIQIYENLRTTRGFKFSSKKFGSGYVYASKFSIQQLIDNEQDETGSHLEIGGKLVPVKCKI